VQHREGGDPVLNAREKVILRHLVTSKIVGVPLTSLVSFSPVDGDIVTAKDEARSNLEAIERLIKADLVTLWVQDIWNTSVDDDDESEVEPVIVVMPTDQGRMHESIA
jgi:hypothetical protein